MKIAIDARFFSQTGIGRYLRNLISSLEKIDDKNEYYILLQAEDYSKILFKGNFKKILADIPWYGFAEQIKLPKLLASLNPDLVHFPHFNVPYFYQGKYVVTIHDLIHQHYQTHQLSTHNRLWYGLKKIGYQQIFGHAIQGAEKIFTPSDFVKQQLVREWTVGADKILVTPEAVEKNFLKLLKKTATKEFQDFSQKFDFQKPYLLYVGNAHLHKNLELLIKVFNQINQKFPEYYLILTGPDNYFWKKILKKFSNPKIIFTGFVTDLELVTLYKNAFCYIMPSLEEGFGIPILEAMSCGCPVLCSKRASLPEVAGEAALFFEPNEEDMIEKFSHIITNQLLRLKLIKNGLKRYKLFDWEKLAQQTLRIYQQV